jgi:predicted chitinase
VQLTHSYNYEAAGEALDLDLVGEPDLALEPDPAAASLAWYWQQHDIQALADAEDWQECRQAVVGYVPNPPGLDRLVQIVEKLL